MKEVSKRFISLHQNYNPLQCMHAPMVPSASLPQTLLTLPFDYSSMLYSQVEPNISYLQQEKPNYSVQEMPVYLPVAQEASPPDLPILDHLPLAYQLQLTPSYQLLQYIPRSPLAPMAVKECHMTDCSPSPPTALLPAFPTTIHTQVDPSARASLLNAVAQVNSRSKTHVMANKSRSSLLESFRSNRCPALALSDIANHGVEFSRDQHGSRFIQQKLEISSSDQIAAFFQELKPSLVDLFSDVFGNYVIQKLLDYGGEEEKQTISMQVLENLKALSLQQYGCRVVQKVLLTQGHETALLLLKGLESWLVECITDQHGNHVVQKAVETVGQPHLDTILKHCLGKIQELSCDPYGCRVIQRILENAQQEQRASVLAEVFAAVEALIQDQYGNYVVQHILDHGSVEEKLRVQRTVEGRIVQLAQHKYASNVIEKCVEKSGEADRRTVVLEVVASGRMGEMIEGQYSNYVLQKIMDTAPPSVAQDLMLVLRAHKTSMEKHSYGKNIKARLDKFFCEK